MYVCLLLSAESFSISSLLAFRRGFSWDFPWWYRSWHLGISPFDVLGWCWSRRNMHEWRGSAPDWRQNAQERRRLMLLSLQHCLSDDAAADTDDASAYVFWSLQSLLIILPLMLVTAPRWDWLFVLSLANLCCFGDLLISWLADLSICIKTNGWPMNL